MNCSCPQNTNDTSHCKYCICPDEKEKIFPQGYVQRLRIIKKQLVQKLLIIEKHLLQNNKGGE